MRYEDFISRFEKRQKTQRGVLVKCPAHDDGTASLSISPASDGGVLLKCFANCSTERVVSSLGLKMSDLFVGEPPRLFSIPQRKAAPKSNAEQEKPVIEKIYSYENELGREVYQAIRLNPKSFRQRHQKDGQWIWTMDGVERVLYHLPQVLKSDTVIVCEGEKDADNLTELGYAATCNVGGAGKWLDGYTACLKDKNIIICGDNDKAGKEHVELVFESIAKTAKTVKIVELPSRFKDVSEFIESFKTKEEAKSSFEDILGTCYPHVKGLKLPIFSIGELEESYRSMVRKMGENSFSLGSWLPSLRVIRPLIGGELCFLIGDTGTGKTGLAQSITMAASHLPRLFFELELPKELMYERYVSMITNFKGEQVEEIYRSENKEVLGDRVDEKLKKLFICPESRLSLQQIEDYIYRSELKIGERPKMVVIDYIQLMQAGGANRREKISDLAEGLKVMAKSTGCIILVTSQVKRPTDDDPEIGLHDAKESGSIESSCGLLIGAWRDPEDSTLMHLKILKSTKGGGGLHVKCNFDGARMKITERSPIEPQDVPKNYAD